MTGTGGLAAELVAALDPAARAELIALLDPAAETRYRHALCREAYIRGRREGWREGYVRATEDIKRAQQQIYSALQPAGRRHTYNRPALSAEQIAHRARASWTGPRGSGKEAARKLSRIQPPLSAGAA
jgi:hypothetical protein